MKVEFYFLRKELERIRLAADSRRMSVREFVREAADVAALETLSPVRRTTDPYERRAPTTYPEPARRR